VIILKFYCDRCGKEILNQADIMTVKTGPQIFELCETCRTVVMDILKLIYSEKPV
jgi:hypothetical protein